MTNDSPQPHARNLDEALLARRALLSSTAAAMAAAAVTSPLLHIDQAEASQSSGLDFDELPHGIDETHHVAEGFTADVLIRWGDPLFADAPGFVANALTAEGQSKQFGYNCDFIGYFPLPYGSNSSDHGLLCVNHEYTTSDLMFADVKGFNPYPAPTRRHVDVEMAAHGHAVVEVKRRADGTWAYVQNSSYNRRITASGTQMTLSGPAAGHDRLKTKDDPTGRKVIGTLNNCAGGQTPWGTCLIAEENIHYYFAGDPRGTAEAGNHLSMGLNQSLFFSWGDYINRFDVEKEPHEPNRFGWVVEYDPYTPDSVPIKRTALGRFRHEGATSVISAGGQVVVYSGDDQMFQYVYKFVSTGLYDPENREQNRNLLDEGILYVARFQEDGTLKWLPLVWGHDGLTPDNGFADQADVLIETRRAASFLGATPMDRPEDVETNPVTGSVFVALSKNPFRRAFRTDAANPRERNRAGHILELIPPGGEGALADHAATTFSWTVFLQAGDPQDPRSGAQYHADVSKNGWLANPDNLAFDPKGRLWIATDGASDFDTADGVWATEVRGTKRALTRHFFKCPVGAELTGPAFTPDGETLFCSVQHPGQGGGSTYDKPTTRWPDFEADTPPRPSVIAITRRGGGSIS
ncbi:MAG: PhoX family phosphatase [Rhodospirillaceae bacterium]|nr:PhoX family phosphatase [Rhodospirillaceae bacterium]